MDLIWGMRASEAKQESHRRSGNPRGPVTKTTRKTLRTYSVGLRDRQRVLRQIDVDKLHHPSRMPGRRSDAELDVSFGGGRDDGGNGSGEHNLT